MKIGYAMYSARDLTKDPESMRSTLKALAEMGYEGVEFFVYAGTKPEELKEMVQEFGLEAIGTHVHKPRWDGDTEGEIEYAVKAGIPYLVYPWVAPEDRTEEFYNRLPGYLDGLAKQCGEKGIRLQYHNHDFEFKAMGEGRVMDHILGAGKEFAFELDTFWAQHAGVNVLDYLKKLGDRVPMIHIKDYLDADTMPPKFTPIGTGKLSANPGFIRAARELGKEWVIVELDNSPYDPLESARVSIENIKKML